MRSSTVIRRSLANVVRGEEKKDDSDGNQRLLPVLNEIDSKDRRRRHGLVSGRFMTRAALRAEYAKGLFLGGLLFFSLIYVVSNSGVRGAFSAPLYHIDTNLKVKVPIIGSRPVSLPGPFISSKEDFYEPNNGNLGHSDLSKGVRLRNITYSQDDPLLNIRKASGHKYRGLKRYYHAFDDDEKRNPLHGYGRDMKNWSPKKYHCRQTAFHHEQFPTCNDFHAFDFAMYASKNQGSYLGGGSFRDVFMIKKENGDPLVVLKTASYGTEYKPANWEYYRMDAAVASAVTPHPLFVDIYGSCALAMLSQPMPLGDVNEASIPRYSRHHCDRFSLKGHSHLVLLNDLNATTKLEWALQMAESIAMLHYHPRGVIVHDDVQPFQWLIAEDGSIKLNDFNRAEFMLYDEEHKQYCKYKNGVGPGDFRAPEEYRDKPLDEKIDIFSLGNNFYGLLTGVYPIYEICNDDKAGKAVRDGARPFIDPRWMEHSFAEAELVKAIDDCWHRHPENRASAAELVVTLRESVRKNRELLAMGLEKLPETGE